MTAKINPALASLAVPLAELHEDPKNARKYDERNLAAIGTRGSGTVFGSLNSRREGRAGLIRRSGLPAGTVRGRIKAGGQSQWA